MDIFLVYDGLKGLVENKIYPLNENIINKTSALLFTSGTCIYSSRCPEFLNKTVRLEAIDNLSKLGIDFLVMLGGDGTFKAAKKICTEGSINVIYVPASIDGNPPYK